MSNKHKHYEIGVAKLADVSLVKFVKLPNKWVETQSENWNIASEYFLCLPQHKEACLHWLNGGEVQMRELSGGDWQIMTKSDLWVWSKYNNTMSNEWEFRIKPKKEKRWIGVYGNHVTEAHFETLEKARSFINGCPSLYSKLAPDNWQFIEIEVEV